MPPLAMAPKAVPLMSKCADSARHAPPGQESVMVTVTGRPEQALLPVHLICRVAVRTQELVDGQLERAWHLSREYIGVYTDLVACAASFAVLEEGGAAGRDHRPEWALADITFITTSTTCIIHNNGTKRLPLICRKTKDEISPNGKKVNLFSTNR